MKKSFKTMFTFVMVIAALVPFIKVNASEEKAIGTTEAKIKGTNYEIDVDHSKITLDSNANVELTGNADNYFINVKENATNVTITLNNYSVSTGGWRNAINLNSGSSIKVILVGKNSITVGNEASAIRVIEGTSLVIEGSGKLTAKISNGGSAASSAVIGSQYDLNCGDITINGGTIITEYEGGGTPSGIGTGDWYSNEGDVKGNITINGGNITTSVLGSARGGSVMNIGGNGNAIIYTELVDGTLNEFNGIIFDTNNNTSEVMGNVTISEDLSIPANYTLTISADSSLTISEGVTLTNEGEIENLGSIMNNGNIQNEGTLTNTGSLNSDTEIEGVTGNTINPASYEYLEGTNLKFIKDEDKTLTFRINADYSLFENGGKVYVNDKLLDEKDYTSKSGSTIIKLDEQYMNSLNTGSYVLKVIFNNKAEAKTTFTVEKKKEEEKTATVKTTNETTASSKIENPKTSDKIIIYLSLLGLSIIGLIGMHFKKKLFN
ncbi:MAG: hypothetical protein E7158_01420 [Firmicutes bacterium]|nr:hypothetical protein [Bacillota bacterium]